ncbi:MAG TPA: TolC family protein [Pirellulaceae bacterium]|jgi:outer membrane protein TolC
MPRIWHVLTFVLLALAGCTWDNALRRKRDAALLSRDDPPRYELLSNDAGPPPPLVTDAIRIYGNPAENQDGGLELHAAMVEGLKNSRIVRLVDSTGVSAAPITGYDVDANRARVNQALAAFDTTFNATFLTTRYRQPPDAIFGPGLAIPTLRDQMTYGAGFTKPLITGGQATLFYDPSPSYLFLPLGNGANFNPLQIAATTMAFNQPLLRGAGIDVNSAPIQIAQITAEQSAWDFKKEVLLTCRYISDAYWELHAARVALKAVGEVLPLLEEAHDLQQKAFEAGRSIYADVAKAQSQLYTYRQQRAALLSRVMAAELRLRNLMGLPPADGWNLIPTTKPDILLGEIDTNLALDDALANQPDIVRQRLNIAIRQKQLLVAQNGLLPQLDFNALYRMNGIGDNLGSALNQMYTNAYADWQMGATFSVPLGRRQAQANLRATELLFARERAMFEQARFTTAQQLADVFRQIRLDYEQYQEASQRLKSADEWLSGTRLRYQHPLPVGDGQNWLFQFLNDYLLAVRARTDAAIDTATLLASYNADLVRLEQVKGTLLYRYGIDFAYDPCKQVKTFEKALYNQPTEATGTPTPAEQMLPPPGAGNPPAAEELPGVPARDMAFEQQPRIESRPPAESRLPVEDVPPLEETSVLRLPPADDP